jgi:hypothetical protein
LEQVVIVTGKLSASPFRILDSSKTFSWQNPPLSKRNHPLNLICPRCQAQSGSQAVSLRRHVQPTRPMVSRCIQEQDIMQASYISAAFLLY